MPPTWSWLSEWWLSLWSALSPWHRKTGQLSGSWQYQSCLRTTLDSSSYLAQISPKIVLVSSAAVVFNLSLNFFAVASADWLNLSQSFSSSLQPCSAACLACLVRMAWLCLVRSTLLLLLGTCPSSPGPDVSPRDDMAWPWHFSVPSSAAFILLV